MAPGTTMEVGQDGVAIITLANPPVNALHPKGMLNLRLIGLRAMYCALCIVQSHQSDLGTRVCCKYSLYTRLMVLCSAVLPLQPRKGGTQPI